MDEKPPEPCPDPWCDGPIGHAECVGERMLWAMRQQMPGVSMSDAVTPDVPGVSLADYST